MDDARPLTTPDPAGPQGPAGPPDLAGPPDPAQTGPLSRAAALAHLKAAQAALASGDHHDAAVRFARVVGFDDPAVTAAALLGLGEARYRLDDDGAAVAGWEAAVTLGDTPSSYPAWRNLASSRVRSGDLTGAIEAYRQANRLAPDADKAEIATRLGWLTKETGDSRAARRYFARGRGDRPLLSVTTILIVATVLVSLVALLSTEGAFLFGALALDKAALADGEYWRLWTVTLLHGSLIHLAFNMYALYLVGPIVERWYGPARFFLFYLACAAAGSVGSFVFGGDSPSVGASGAVFGLFGVLLAAGRIHHPVDRQSRGLVSQLGMLILINIAFGFAVSGIDNAAHLGGLAAGLWLGALVPPSGVQTLASLWQRAGEARTLHLARVPGFVPALAVAAVGLVVMVGLIVGTASRAG